METELNHDDLLYSVLLAEGNFVSFFDKIFDFLYRRTDYFKLKKDPSIDLTIAIRDAEMIFKNVFYKYIKKALTEYKLDSANIQKPVILDVAAEEVVSTTEPDSSEDMLVTSETIPDDKNKYSDTNDAPESDQQSEPKIPCMDSDCYNGAKYEGYSWAQTMKDVDIRLKVPEHVTTGKQVRVGLFQGSVHAEILTDGKWNTLKKGDLTWKINVVESTWVLVPGEHVHICLQKLQDRWWESCFVDEPKINIRDIDPSIPYEDLDEETQSKISKLMYNEQQKRLGKPTIEQNKIHNVLKEAWNAEGSPFKGQPFDPSVVDVQNADNL